MICPNCGTENRPGRRFCSSCGSSLTVACPSCGAANEPEDRFCGQCGAALAEGVPAAPGPPATPSQPTAERRLVSVLFADLVGFTGLSETRDAEEVRELLSRYFDECRRLVGRYGGVIEKFIGDAVMAVWGAPVAQEDDAERAVRAALELAAGVEALGAEVEVPLQARVGVLTGEAAVSFGAEGQGMIAGDLVNTASRIQSVATPGTVLVGDATRRASEGAIAYEEAGTHAMKGKEEPVSLWRAARVVGGRKGWMRSSGLEAPFVGRDREMRMLKEMFHATADESRAHLVSVIGVAGIGKTRLSWEFEKYIDGLADEVWWHRGRCLAYGEGVAYWALAEMVRGRAGIVEGEEPASAQAKLRAVVEEQVSDPEERAWVEPRLAHLLGLEERTARDQSDLFSAWRLFFERMTATGATLMIFEDLQWADSALLDFIEHLLEWSRDHPLFIVTLARPEIDERRASWGAGRRSFTSLTLEPLAPPAMEELLRGLVPGLPDDVRRAILDRAEGIPLYAVETVRMLLDRGLLQRSGDEYRPAGSIGELDVPESLQGLIAARLDGLPAEERGLLQDASVMGKTFTVAGLAAMTGRREAELEVMLDGLVRKELLSVQADPRSPERGQYGFLQDLVKRVAYETLSRKERKARHLAVADYLESAWTGEETEVVEIVAAHLRDALEAAPDAQDAPDIRRRAREALVGAGEHAAALAANEEARRSFEQAAELADEDVVRADLIERAAEAAKSSGATEVAVALYQRALELHQSTGNPHAAARVMAKGAELGRDQGRLRETLDRMEEALTVLAGDEPDEDLAMLAAQLGRFLWFAGDLDGARRRVGEALEIAEAERLPEVLSQALNTRSLVLSSLGRHEESMGVLRRSLEIALEHDIPTAAMRAQYNLADYHWRRDEPARSVAYVDDGVALARRRGDRRWEWQFLGASYPLYSMGEWDEALARAAQLPDPERLPEARLAFGCYLCPLPMIRVHRGDLAGAEADLALFPDAETSDDLQERAGYALGTAVLLRARGEYERVIELWDRYDADRRALGVAAAYFRESFIETVESALALGDLARVDDLLDMARALRPGDRPPSLQAHVARLASKLRLVRGEGEGAEEGFRFATREFADLSIPLWKAVTLLEHGEWLLGQGRGEDAGPMLVEAAGTFERLGARPWIERVAAATQQAEPRAATPRV